MKKLCKPCKKGGGYARRTRRSAPKNRNAVYLDAVMDFLHNVYSDDRTPDETANDILDERADFYDDEYDPDYHIEYNEMSTEDLFRFADAVIDNRNVRAAMMKVKLPKPLAMLRKTKKLTKWKCRR